MGRTMPRDAGYAAHSDRNSLAAAMLFTRSPLVRNDEDAWKMNWEIGDIPTEALVRVRLHPGTFLASPLPSLPFQQKTSLSSFHSLWKRMEGLAWRNFANSICIRLCVPSRIFTRSGTRYRRQCDMGPIEPRSASSSPNDWSSLPRYEGIWIDRPWLLLCRVCWRMMDWTRPSSHYRLYRCCLERMRWLMTV